MPMPDKNDFELFSHETHTMWGKSTQGKCLSETPKMSVWYRAPMSEVLILRTSIMPANYLVTKQCPHHVKEAILAGGNTMKKSGFINIEVRMIFRWHFYEERSSTGICLNVRWKLAALVRTYARCNYGEQLVIVHQRGWTKNQNVLEPLIHRDLREQPFVKNNSFWFRWSGSWKLFSFIKSQHVTYKGVLVPPRKDIILLFHLVEVWILFQTAGVRETFILHTALHD